MQSREPAGPAELDEWELADREREASVRRFALPAALLVATLLVKSGIGHALVRIFFSMWVHEVGHAATAWLCGYLAFPGPWLTPIAATRSALFAALVIAGLGGGAWLSWKQEQNARAACLGLFALLAVVCSALLPAASARQLILFMGDGGCLVLGTALMLTLYSAEGSPLRRDWLRWGFLAIGAASFADVFELWWSARHDAERIPFGMNEGAGLSDPSVLSEQFGWSEHQLVHRYVALGIVCLLVLAFAWVRGVLGSAGSNRAALSHGERGSSTIRRSCGTVDEPER